MRQRRRAKEREGPPIGLLSFLSCLLLSSLLWASGFTPGMAKRDGPGPFDAAPIVQGDPNNLDGRTDDLLSFPRGTQVRNNFHANFDTDQGSVVLWWTPEYGASSLSGAGDHYVWYVSASYFLAYEYDTDRFNLTVGGQSLTVASAIASGTTYVLIARWDTRNTLDGVSYAAGLRDADAPSTHLEQVSECWGHRGLYRDGWELVTLVPNVNIQRGKDGDLLIYKRAAS